MHQHCAAEFSGTMILEVGLTMTVVPVLFLCLLKCSWPRIRLRGAAPGLVPDRHQHCKSQCCVYLSVLSQPEIIKGQNSFHQIQISFIGPLSPSIQLDFGSFSSAVYFVPLLLRWLTVATSIIDSSSFKQTDRLSNESVLGVARRWQEEHFWCK